MLFGKILRVNNPVVATATATAAATTTVSYFFTNNALIIWETILGFSFSRRVE